MRTTARNYELIVTRHKIAQVIQDEEILKNHPAFADMGLKIVLGIEKEIFMSRRPKRRNTVLDGKNKHKSPRA